MINFRYHVVSLVAVFMALAIGVALGAGVLGQGINEGILVQAQQDRKELQTTRQQVLQLQALDKYRDDYAELVGARLTRQMLAGQTVLIVTMPDAPSTVTKAVTTAATGAGADVVGQVEINDTVFDPSRAADVTAAVNPFGRPAGFAADATLANKFGSVLGRGFAAADSSPQDDTATAAADALTKAGLISVSGTDKDNRRGELVLVVAAPVTDTLPAPETVIAHVQMDAALKKHAQGVVLAGPNSQQIVGSDVAAARNEDVSKDVVSTVDVADLPSGVTTVVLAAKEQSVGRHGHYGAAASRDAVAPELPIR